MNPRSVNLLIALLAGIFLLSSSAFIVDARTSAIVFQFGSVARIIERNPGLHWKIPFVQNVRIFDTRIQTIDSEPPSPFNTADKQNVVVDSYVKWRVTDVVSFYRNLGNESTATARLQQIVNNALYAEIGKRAQNEVITTKREEIMQQVLRRSNAESRLMGVQVVDVRLKRVDYSQRVSDSVFNSMRAERKRVASEKRSEGNRANITIKAEADKQSETILANAYNEAQEIKGRGDAKAAQIYAQAYSANPEFYKFYRSLEAYKESFKSKGDVMVLHPDTEFFKYFRNPGSK